jgi:hypothetical protein
VSSWVPIHNATVLLPSLQLTPFCRILLENNRSAGQEIPRLLWSPTVHYYVHDTPALVPIQSQMSQVYTLQLYCFNINFNSIVLPTPGPLK